MTVANATFSQGIYHEQGGNILRLKRGTGLIASDDELWGDCPIIEHLLDPTKGIFLNEDFQSYDAAATTGDYTLTAATTGSAAISTTIPGALAIDSGATTANQGANVQRLKSAWIPAANKSIWAEFNVLLTATTPPVTKAQLFVGLAASDTTIIGAGAMTTNNRIGWEILNGGLLQTTFTCDKAGTEATKTGPLLVAATTVALGFKYDGVADTVQQYVNGVATGTAVATANIPKLVMYPSFVCQSDGTDEPILNVSYRIFQLR